VSNLSGIFRVPLQSCRAKGTARRKRQLDFSQSRQDPNSRQSKNLTLMLQDVDANAHIINSNLNLVPQKKLSFIFQRILLNSQSNAIDEIKMQSTVKAMARINFRSP